MFKTFSEPIFESQCYSELLKFGGELRWITDRGNKTMVNCICFRNSLSFESIVEFFMLYVVLGSILTFTVLVILVTCCILNYFRDGNEEGIEVSEANDNCF